MAQVVFYEVSVQVRALCLKMIFDKPPTLKRICECISEVFANNEHVATDMAALVLSVGDGNLGHDMVLDEGDQINFYEDGEDGPVPIGYIDLQTRTLFDA